MIKGKTIWNYLIPAYEIDELILWVKPEVNISIKFALPNPNPIRIPIAQKIFIPIGSTGLFVELALVLKISLEGSISIEYTLGGQLGMDLKRGRDAKYFHEMVPGYSSINLNGSISVGPEQIISLKLLGLPVCEETTMAGIEFEGKMSLVNNPLKCIDVSVKPFVEIATDTLLNSLIQSLSKKFELPHLNRIIHFEQFKEVPKCTADSTPATPTGELSGVVKDKDTQAPLAGVTVVAYDNQNKAIAQTCTEANGTFYFMLPEGHYTFLFSLSGYVNVSNGANVIRDTLTAWQSPILMQKQNPATQGMITGKVVVQGTNAPLSGVLVEASKTGTTQVVATATTNTSGQYSLTVDKGASYSLKYTKSSYTTQTRETFTIYADTAMLDVAMVSSGGAEFAGGNGTAQSPYQISTPQQLDNVRNHLDANFILLNDIDLGSWGNWVPIGAYSYFSGTLNGDEHVIKNMSVNVSSSSSVYAGLFSRLSGTVKNTGIVNANVIATSTGSSAHAGGIAGNSGSASVINNCYITGEVKAVSDPVTAPPGGAIGAWAGGIVGENGSTISNCRSTAKIAVTNYSDSALSPAYGGGIAGNNGSTISNCSNKGDVTATSFSSSYLSQTHAGGIAGLSSSTISSCYNTGKVVAYSYYSLSSTVMPCAYAGGIAGNIGEATISNCYNTGIVSAIASSDRDACVGGIVGFGSSTISNCYNMGAVSATASSALVGGIVGRNYSSISNNYYLNNIAYAVGLNEGGTLTNVLALTNTQMKQQSSYVGFDFSTVWAISPSVNNGYPYLRGLQP